MKSENIANKQVQTSLLPPPPPPPPKEHTPLLVSIIKKK